MGGGETVLAGVKARAAAGRYIVSRHANRRLDEWGVLPADLLGVIASAILLEDYPTYYKGPCCLIYGETAAGRPLHVVCSTTPPDLTIITVYEPTMPKWRTPTERNR